VPFLCGGGAVKKRVIGPPRRWLTPAQHLHDMEVLPPVPVAVAVLGPASEIVSGRTAMSIHRYLVDLQYLIRPLRFL